MSERFDSAALLRQVDHRPWPLPARRWALRMVWRDLAFLHWPVPPAALRPLLPAGLELDCFDGEAWIGVVPFRMTGATPRGLPALPGLSAFCELNVRTYVRAEGKAGVWFFSLDAASRIAVRAARLGFHLPYFDARMRCTTAADGTVDYASERTHRRAPPAVFEGRYRPTGPVERAAPGSLAAWLTERYCLWAADRRGRLFRGDIHHAPWPLRPGAVELRRDTTTEQIGLVRPERAPLVHLADRLDVVAWMLQPA